MSVRQNVLTIYALAKFDDFPQRHRFPVFRGEMRQDTRPESDLLVQIAFGEAIA